MRYPRIVKSSDVIWIRFGKNFGVDFVWSKKKHRPVFSERHGYKKRYWILFRWLGVSTFK